MCAPACCQIQSATMTANSSFGSHPKMERGSGGSGQAMLKRCEGSGGGDAIPRRLPATRVTHAQPRSQQTHSLASHHDHLFNTRSTASMDGSLLEAIQRGKGLKSEYSSPSAPFPSLVARPQRTSFLTPTLLPSCRGPNSRQVRTRRSRSSTRRIKQRRRWWRWRRPACSCACCARRRRWGRTA